MYLKFFVFCLAMSCLLLFPLSLRGAEMCVDPNGGEGVYLSLQEALYDAASNAEDDTIKVVQGTYNGNFLYYSLEGFRLLLEGGYTAGCECRAVNPVNTVLQGEDVSKSVLYLNNNGGGDLLIDGFTITNGGGADVSGRGLYAYSGSNSGPGGNVVVSNNIVYGNVSSVGGGISAYSESLGDPLAAGGNVTLVNNTVTGNQAKTYSGGGVFAKSYSEKNAAGIVSFINNTVYGNRAKEHGGGVVLYIFSGGGTGAGGGGALIRACNNIVFGNSAGLTGDDIYINNPLGDDATGFYNLYNDMEGSWSASDENINVDPRFVSNGNWDDSGTPGETADDIWINGDYHLQQCSPCIGAGIFDKKVFMDYGGGTWAFYNYDFVPDEDFEGDPRTDDWHETEPDHYYKYCEIGADEYIPRSLKPMLPGMPLLLLDD